MVSKCSGQDHLPNSAINSMPMIKSAGDKKSIASQNFTISHMIFSTGISISTSFTDCRFVGSGTGSTGTTGAICVSTSAGIKPSSAGGSRPPGADTAGGKRNGALQLGQNFCLPAYLSGPSISRWQFGQVALIDIAAISPEVRTGVDAHTIRAQTTPVKEAWPGRCVNSVLSLECQKDPSSRQGCKMAACHKYTDIQALYVHLVFLTRQHSLAVCPQSQRLPRLARMLQGWQGICFGSSMHGPEGQGGAS